MFEMLSFASTIVFARPGQFKIPATISAAAVGMAAVLYAAFVRSRRGHLLHLSDCMARHEKDVLRPRVHRWQRVPGDEDSVDRIELSATTTTTTEDAE